MLVVEYPLESALIGILADSHIPARASRLLPRLFSVFEGVSLILHAGDIEDDLVLEELKTIAPVEAVAGNMDPPGLRRRLGTTKIITFKRVSIGLMHGFGAPGIPGKKALEEFRKRGVSCLVFGHTHEPLVEEREGLLYINPGSVSDPRRGSRPSCALLRLQDGKLQGQIVTLD